MRVWGCLDLAGEGRERRAGRPYDLEPWLVDWLLHLSWASITSPTTPPLQAAFRNYKIALETFSRTK
ncbi:hypothetical protein DIJ64_03095 [Mycobacterium leprae]|uniref:Uncharacterized protein n=1 Tax=Mycobacterium leprae TaxID=1769 RepID=A0AAD0KRC1_MYCLR|nr:hypothetical protein DIJ64_03095 [Mycobacterium leprae]OAR20911.1 hypothetical protein A8144_08625 [Mycobacterium leprae 3125609]